jgi:hypothetical protein
MAIALPDAPGNSRCGISRRIMGVCSFQEAVSERNIWRSRACARQSGYGKFSALLPSIVSEYRFELFSEPEQHLPFADLPGTPDRCPIR